MGNIQRLLYKYNIDIQFINNVYLADGQIFQSLNLLEYYLINRRGY